MKKSQGCDTIVVMFSVNLSQSQIVFFDGYCHLCDGTVAWMIKTDKRQRLQFAPLQGQTAKKLLADLSPETSQTVLYYRSGKTLAKSTAILTALVDMGGIWSLFRLGFIIPVFFRDLIYDFIAKNRFRVFGRRETCHTPTPAEKSRFLP